ncbi:unnamed protein product [Nippostrongylus brasiliensis]|uniref:NET domain-containing protein n=1 Tax=Nippostrongylus brasiliensis TaxID=27835 RepID=A0A0N4Y4C9_NIPBR|nr:unnamed protein product [Nippostrongylus brasiliensis]
METVPDMDALLDELEEVVVGSRRKQTKIPEPVNEAVVIDLPVHLRKLSDKETIRIELKPPDPTLPSFDECSTTERVSLVNTRNLSTSNGHSGKIAAARTLVSDSKVDGLDVSDEPSITESENDTEFDEVLKYLDQFDDKQLIVKADKAQPSAVEATTSSSEEVADSVPVVLETAGITTEDEVGVEVAPDLVEEKDPHEAFYHQESPNGPQS